MKQLAPAVSISPGSAPKPSSFALLGIGAAGWMGHSGRRRMQATTGGTSINVLIPTVTPHRLTLFAMAALLVSVAPTASADIVFSDFASGYQRYEPGGYTIGGFGPGGPNNAFGSSFTPTASYTFTSLEIPLFCYYSTNIDTYCVSITSDSGSGTPGTTTLASFDVLPGTLGPYGSLLTFNASGPPITLAAGTSYWVTVVDITSQGADLAGWNSTLPGTTGVVANSLNGGATWNALGLQYGPGAFEVDGAPLQAAPAPEPATSTMVIAGALGFLTYGWHRRRNRRATAAR
jgi:hypothetical protein